MNKNVFGFLSLLMIAAPSAAQVAPALQLTPDQKGYIVYDRCIMHAAIKASHTDAKDEEIFGMAKADCAPIRAQVVIGQESNRQFLSALDAADADKAANFPAWIKGVRERRKALEVKSSSPTTSAQR